MTAAWTSHLLSTLGLIKHSAHSFGSEAWKKLTVLSQQMEPSFFTILVRVTPLAPTSRSKFLLAVKELLTE
jgi:hypothetical protein